MSRSTGCSKITEKMCALCQNTYKALSAQTKKASGLAGGLGGSVGASSYNIVQTWRNSGNFIPNTKVQSPLLAAVAPSCQKKHDTHTYKLSISNKYNSIDAFCLLNLIFT